MSTQNTLAARAETLRQGEYAAELNFTFLCVSNEVSLSVEASTEELKDDECLGRILKMSSERVCLLDSSETRGIRPASSWEEKQRSWMSNLAVKFRPFYTNEIAVSFYPAAQSVDVPPQQLAQSKKIELKDLKSTPLELL